LTPRRWIGRSAALDGQVHRLGATWELLLDPATFLFFVGGLVVLAMRAMSAMKKGEGGRGKGEEEVVSRNQ